MVDPSAPALKRVPARFFGEPIGLAFLAGTEAWERFSYYGMVALLPLYMSQALFLPERIAGVWGFAAVRGALEAVFGPMSNVALASQLFGLYAGLVYFTPVLGGIIADRWMGRHRAVTAGAVLMTAGHVAMAFDASFLVALGLLITGCGLLKGNISAQVGDCYARDDGQGRARGFAIFSTAINVGAMLGPLLCGLLAQLYGWHAGFAVAGLLMLLGLLTYLAGGRYLPAEQVRLAHRVPAPRMAGEGRTIILLMLVIALTIFHSVIFFQNTNIALIWIEGHVDRGFGGFTIPSAWFNAIDPTASILGVPPLLAWWKHLAAKGQEPNELTKMMIGVCIATIANLLLVVGTMQGGGGRISVLWPIVYDVLLGISFIYYWPTLLGLVSRAAPPRVRSTMMGVVFLSLFVSYSIIGSIGQLYEPLGATRFWQLQVAIGSTGAVLLLLCRQWLTRALQPGR
jgi:proton-dependent oligopeptide transporter, POT family